MSKTRRVFLTTAGAGAAGIHELAQAQGRDHDHEHQAVPSDLTLRVKALESLLVEKGWWIGPRWMRWSTPTSTRSGRATARAWWRGPGSIPPISSAC